MERIVPFSSEVSKICENYMRGREYFSGRKITSDLFFLKKNQTKCDNKAAYDFFRQILFKVKIPHGGRGKGPRIHDLRHTFACHSLKSMTDSGLDFYQSLPILSNYLGHQSIEATNMYVRLTAELYPDILNDMNKTCSFIFLKSKNPEE